jgi:hypothetical protein
MLSPSNALASHRLAKWTTAAVFGEMTAYAWGCDRRDSGRLIGIIMVAFLVYFLPWAGSMTGRRFPPPWTVEDIGAAFVVIDNTAAALPLKEALRNIAVCRENHLCYTSSHLFWWSSGYSVYCRFQGR